MMECIKCADCIHDGVCYLQEVTNDIDKQLKDFGCDDYKNKADFVEVVKCCECTQHMTTSDTQVYYCKERNLYTDKQGFCHCGERIYQPKETKSQF